MLLWIWFAHHSHVLAGQEAIPPKLFSSLNPLTLTNNAKMRYKICNDRVVTIAVATIRETGIVSQATHLWSARPSRLSRGMHLCAYLDSARCSCARLSKGLFQVSLYILLFVKLDLHRVNIISKAYPHDHKQVKAYGAAYIHTHTRTHTLTQPIFRRVESGGFTLR